MLEREREIKFVAYKNSKTKGAMTAEDMSLWRREDNEEIKHVITSDIWESSSAVQEESDNDSEAEGLSPRKRKNKPNASRGGILISFQ